MLTKALRNRIFVYCTLTAIVLISTFILWLPFLVRAHSWLGLMIPDSNFLYIYKHFDGPLYVIAAKTLYNPELIENLRLEAALSPLYFAAHFPLYPLIIRIFAPLFGYLKSMIFVNVFFTVFFAVMFYKFVVDFKLSSKPLALTTILLFLPRFLVVRGVGAPESLFLFLVITSLYFFEKRNYFFGGIFGALSVITRSPGMLLFVAYSLAFLEELIKTKKFKLSWFWILLIPLGLLGVFDLYGLQYKDFFAYFHSGDNIHLMYPFAAFNFRATWVGTAWLEEIIFYFFFYLLAVFKLKGSPRKSLFYFALVYFIATVFIQHRDISRYSLPLWPLALIAFEDFFTSKRFLIVGAFLLIGIYLYAWNFLAYNIMPISDWSAYL